MDNCEVVTEAFIKREEETLRPVIDPAAVKTGGYRMKGLDSNGVWTSSIPISQELFQAGDEVIFEIHLINKLLGEKSNKATTTLVVH